MQPPGRLFEGYEQVQEFGPEDEYESEEEVCYVTLDLGEIEPSLVPSASSYRLIGLDSPTPYLQLQGTVFKGRHDTLLGTELLFADDKDHNQEWNKRSVTHLANVEKRIVFKEVTLVPKWTTDPSGQHHHQHHQHQDKGKGKEESTPFPVDTPETELNFPSPLAPSTSAGSTIDRMTGMAPQSTAKRGRRPGRGRGGGGSGSAAAGGSSRGGSSAKRSRKAKGKTRSVEETVEEPEETGPVIPAADSSMSMMDDNMDDMYVDE